LHLHEPLAPSITIPVLLAHPAPLVGTFHAAGEQTPYRWLGNSPRRLSRRLDARVAVSDTAAALARRYLGGTYEVLFNGIDARPFVIVTRGPVNTSTVLFLGRDEPRKGLEVLLDAMPLLPAHIELWIAGKGTDHGSLHELHGHNPRIRWLGQLTDDEKIARLRTASVVCVPSLYGESFGIVLLEAMAAGTPIVASDLPAYRTLAHEGGAAHLVPPADPAALANGLRRVLDNTAYANALEAAGVAIAQRYSMQALAEQYLTIYKAVVARRRSQQSPNNRPSAAAGP
jgi:phosphatidylinositol alpha-mannosyltransferase